MNERRTNGKKKYIDNIRWITVALVVVYHVIFIFNGTGTLGGVGPLCLVQYQDAVLFTCCTRGSCCCCSSFRGCARALLSGPSYA